MGPRKCWDSSRISCMYGHQNPYGPGGAPMVLSLTMILQRLTNEWELTVFAMVYNLVRMVMWHSGILQRIGVGRISFPDALWWLGALSTAVPLGALIISPVRPHRVEPRVRKRRS